MKNNNNKREDRFKIKDKCRRCGNTRFRTRKNYPFGKKSKAVIQYDLSGHFIKEYYSISEAGRDNKISQGNISKCCTGIRNYAGRFKWKYKLII